MTEKQTATQNEKCPKSKPTSAAPKEAPIQVRQMKNEAEAESKLTSATQINFDIYSKSGVKLTGLALVDPTLSLNFMCYGTWVLFGKPTLKPLEKPSLECSESLEKCIGWVHQTIHINSHQVEGDFHVMAPNVLHKDLVLGRH